MTFLTHPTRRKGVVCLLMTAFSLSMATGARAADSAATRPTALSRDAADARARLITKVAYTLSFSLDGEKPQYTGSAKIDFTVRPNAKDTPRSLMLDFEDGTVLSLALNGEAITDIDHDRYDGHHVYFPVSKLKKGRNRIEIGFSHAYSASGSGLQRSKDPTDGRSYLFTDFEPYNAHRAFPCFDQPDLKASYQLTVEAPSNWHVISNTLETSTHPATTGRKTWTFPKSPVFATYVFALHAGPYAVWKSAAKLVRAAPSSPAIPLRLFARRSVSKYVDAKEWFEVTRKGLDFYSLQFGYPYPYKKYDQIIVPDFNPGAMENVAAVTFNERFIFRDKVTQDRRRQRAEVILHEMAHMWFGDLVTMRWWNGIWLNESFATFMSAWATDQATRFRGSWRSFFGEKTWAYWQDQLVTTHPIEVPVRDTAFAETNFDGITYGKGAATLKQLRYFLGEDDFREGIQRYFELFANGNATLGDFIQKLSEASSRDLRLWEKVWLLTSGVNTVRAEWSCKANARAGKQVISSFSLIQTKAPELRPHRTEVALFNFPRGQSKRTARLALAGKTLPVSYSGGQTPVPALEGRPCPDFVFPNFDDEDYAKIELDPVSLKAVLGHLSQIDDPFVRQMLWHTLWEMVIDGKLKVQDYAQAVLRHVGQEKETENLRVVLGTLANPNAHWPSVLRYLGNPLRKRYAAKFESFTRSHLAQASAGSDLQLIWFDAFLNSASSRGALRYLESLLKGKAQIAGLPLGQERRWEIVSALARNGAKAASALIDAEYGRDSTDMGLSSALAAQASLPDPAMKKRWLDRFLMTPSQAAAAARPSVEASPKAPAEVTAGKKLVALHADKPASLETIALDTLSISKLRDAMSAFHVMGREDLSQSTVEDYFSHLYSIATSARVEDQDYARRFASSLFPSLCEQGIVDKTTAFLNAHPDLPIATVKTLKVSRQEEERCVRARAISEKTN